MFWSYPEDSRPLINTEGIHKTSVKNATFIIIPSSPYLLQTEIRFTVWSILPLPKLSLFTLKRWRRIELPKVFIVEKYGNKLNIHWRALEDIG